MTLKDSTISEMISLIPVCIAILGIIYLEVQCIIHGINHMVTVTAFTLIAGLAGYEVKDALLKIRDNAKES